jgi:hypothetical protein
MPRFSSSAIQRIKKAYGQRIESAADAGDTATVAVCVKALESVCRVEGDQPRLAYLRALELGYRAGAFDDK